MVLVSLRYRFLQKIRAPAREAFRWCTDFAPSDGALFSEKTQRSVLRLTDDAVILEDFRSPKGSPLRIRRLVRMDPRTRSWTNTHLDGPFRHSQFWYRIVADGPRACHLEFEGFHLMDVPKLPSAPEIRRRARWLQTHDSAEWRNHLAPALESDLAGARRGRTGPSESR